MKLNYKSFLLSTIMMLLTACGGGSGDSTKDDKKDSIVSADGKTMLLSLRTMKTGTELWTTNGSENGTNIIKDINTVGNESMIDEIVEMNGILYFRAYSSQYGEELWRSDGTKKGTYVVKDIWKGSSRSRPTQLTVINNTLFFVASDFEHGTRLWKSDGTESGTIMIDKAFAPSYSNGPTYISHLTKVGNTLFFSANDGIHGTELWKSDGSVAGTVMVKDVYPGAEGHFQGMSSFIAVNGRLYFKANGLWTSDGTEAGTHILEGVSCIYPKKVDEVLYCHSKNSPLLKIGDDGSKTVLKSFYLAENLVKFNDKVYFFGRITSRDKYLLWKTDGTAAGTVQVSDKAFHPYTLNLKKVNGALYFNEYIEADLNNDIQRRFSLWKMDATEKLTNIKKLDNHLGAIKVFETFDDKLLFLKSDNEHGAELWTGDSSLNSVQILKDIKPGREGSRARKFIKVGNTVYFTAQSEQYNYQLWKTDGTTAGTVLVDGVDSGTGDSNPSEFIQMNDDYYFLATDGKYGKELWKSDGTDEGTQMVKDVVEGNFDNVAGVKNMSVINNTIYFNAVSKDRKIFQLWKSDGTESGTAKLKDFPIDDNDDHDFYNTKYYEVNGTILFRGYDSTHGFELWTTDGTPEGTKLFKDIYKNNYDSDVEIVYDIHNDKNSSLTRTREYVTINKVLYFKAEDPINGKALWRSDGTKEGTKVLLPFPKGYYNYNYAKRVGYGPNNLTDVNGTLFFSMNVDNNYTELWKSNGTEEGTKVVKRFKKLYQGNLPFGFTNINGILYFVPIYETSRANKYGWELWKSDGTKEGTTKVAHIGKDKYDSYHKMGKPTYFNNKIYFTLPDNEIGTELWISDGTQEGTKLFKDIRVGKESSYPKIRGILNDKLLFEATDNEGRKLWKTDGTVEGIELVKSGLR